MCDFSDSPILWILLIWDSEILHRTKKKTIQWEAEEEAEEEEEEERITEKNMVVEDEEEEQDEEGEVDMEDPLLADR